MYIVLRLLTLCILNNIQEQQVGYRDGFIKPILYQRLNYNTNSLYPHLCLDRLVIQTLEQFSEENIHESFKKICINCNTRPYSVFIVNRPTTILDYRPT